MRCSSTTPATDADSWSVSRVMAGGLRGESYLRRRCFRHWATKSFMRASERRRQLARKATAHETIQLIRGADPLLGRPAGDAFLRRWRTLDVEHPGQETLEFVWANWPCDLGEIADGEVRGSRVRYKTGMVVEAATLKSGRGLHVPPRGHHLGGSKRVRALIASGAWPPREAR